MDNFYNVDNSAALSGYPGDPPEDPSGLPSDAEMLGELDAYGHLKHTLHCLNPDASNCEDYESDSLLAFDWKVFAHPEHKLGDLIVAYHVMFECPGSIETVDEGIFCIDTWTQEEIEGWDGAPCINAVDGVNEGTIDGSWIGYEQIDEFSKKVSRQFKLDVQRARKDLGEDE